MYTYVACNLLQGLLFQVVQEVPNTKICIDEHNTTQLYSLHIHAAMVSIYIGVSRAIIV